MTEPSTPASTLKIRIRFDTVAPSSEDDPPPPATLNLLRVGVFLGVLVLLVAAIFGIRRMMQQEAPPQVSAPVAEVTSSPAVVTVTPPSAPEINSAPRTAAGSSTRQESVPHQTNRVVRAALTGTPRKHQPVQELTGELPASDVTKRFYFFTEVREVTSRLFTHRWEYRGKVVAQIPFSPSGKNWSGSSSKQIPTHMQGAWRVVLADEHGSELESVIFIYGKELTAAQN